MNQALNSVADPLAQLEEIVPPTMASWWPLAWGWWVLIAIISLALLGMVMMMIVRHQRLAIQREALTHFTQIVMMPDEMQISACDQLLRRVLLSYFSREKIASLTGESWLYFLDHFLPDTQQGFSSLQNEWMSAIYKPKDLNRLNSEALQRCMQQVEVWLKHALPLSKSMMDTAIK